MDAAIDAPGGAGGAAAAGGTTASGLLSFMSGFIAGLSHHRPWEDDLAPLLARLGADLALSRAALFEVHSGQTAGLGVTCRIDWARAGLPLLAGNTHPPIRPDEADALQRDWAERRTRGEMIEGRTDDLTGYLRAFFQAAEVVSFYSVPVMVDGRWWGHFCISSDDPARVWTSEERAGLQALTELIALAVDRSRGQSSLSEATRLAMLAAALDGIVTIDEAGQIVDFNPAAEAMFGFRREEVMGRPLGETIVPPAARAAHRAGMTRYLASGQSQILGRRIEVDAIDREGRIFPIELAITEIKAGHRRLFTAYVRNISDRIRAREALERLAYTDTLTGLPNRAGLLKRVRDDGEAVAGALVLRLPELAILRASLGDDFIRQLIRAIADRLLPQLPGNATLARTSESEFAIVVNAGVLPEPLAEEMAALLQAPVEVEGRRFFLHARMGLAAGPGPADQVLRDAEMASCAEGTSLDGPFQIFDRSLRADHQQRLAMEVALREALAASDGDIHPMFQPVVESRSGRVVGFEALARWRHPRLGPVAPTDFIPLAETAGLIDQVGERILDQALAACAQWNAMRQAAGQPPRFVAVNLAASQLTVPDLAERIAALLARHGVPGTMLHLELTESTLLAQPDVAAQKIQQLKEIGCHVAIDDFGTGYSSFSYLQHLPADVLKIDRSFMVELATKPRARKIVAVMVDLAHALGMSVIGEGVEAPDVLAAFESLGGDHVQGFLTGRPMPLDAALDHPDGIVWARQD
ncbi:EAL domain-containing protein [Ancylobacter sp. WKF20]|uniref:putative bifunctional diguanylate cyclase/phosphodiesterase n=1 Tax=Ancylobacter sp. WKF20 TaxID=3039801 RepID=UPI0024344AFD|nr:EAL domain-containing protein [Ancylobacter sp. WKF20]WGD29820.1 EAL domain-containing protein [Ancylobacter sp. WKF20]